MTLKEARDWASVLPKLAKRIGGIPIAEEAMIVLDDRIAELEAKYETRGQKCHSGHVNTLPLSLWDCPMCTDILRVQRDDLLAACRMALKRKPFPVGWTGLKETLEDAVAKAEGKP